MLQPRRTPELRRDLGLASRSPRCPSLMVPTQPNSVYSAPRRLNELMQTQLPLRAASTSKIGQDIGFRSPRPTRVVGTSRRLLFQTDQHCMRSPRHKDKEFMQQISKRLEVYLKQVGGFEELLKRGFLHMTTKDVTSVANHLLAFVGIEQPKLQTGHSQAEQLINALQQLGYASKVNKSCLLMPSAQQYYGHVMLLLDFLLDFAPSVESTDVQEFCFGANSNEKQEEQLYSEVAKLYPKKLNEQEAHKTSAVMCNELDADIQRMESELHNLQLEEASSPLAETQLCAEVTGLEAEYAACQLQLQTTNLAYAEQEQLLGKQSIELWRKSSMLEHLQRQVHEQHCSRSNYDDMLDNYAQHYDELQLLCRQFNEFSERAQIQKMQLRRVRKELLDSIEAFNVHMRDLSYSTVLKIDCSWQLELPLEPTLAEIEERRQMLRELRHKLEAMQQLQQNHLQNLHMKEKQLYGKVTDAP